MDVTFYSTLWTSIPQWESIPTAIGVGCKNIRLVMPLKKNPQGLSQYVYIYIIYVKLNTMENNNNNNKNNSNNSNNSDNPNNSDKGNDNDNNDNG